MNKVILMGRLTRDPEVRYGGANNSAVARFSLAVDRRFKRDGDEQTRLVRQQSSLRNMFARAQSSL